MTIDAATRAKTRFALGRLNRRAAGSMPQPGALSAALSAILPTRRLTGQRSVTVDPQVPCFFLTAAVDMWHRSVHSFLVSCSLTVASPLWAAVAGYYSSHYSVRAIAHLLGYFYLFTRKVSVFYYVTQGRPVCDLQPKGTSPEHQVYWGLVKADPHFVADPLYTTNPPGEDQSDVSHRNWANYADHLTRFQKFEMIDEHVLAARVEQISHLEVSVPPIPRRHKYPDLEAVHIVAYHRLVRFRHLLDELSGDPVGRFWGVHRQPFWVPAFLDFQLVEPRPMGLDIV